MYNIDKTGKYWKLKPDWSLTILSEHSKKKDKARITACLVYNVTSTDKLLIWFISKAKRPYCFRHEHLYGLESIRAI